MRLVTWNINSVRRRVSLIPQLKRALAPDVICLQEIKCCNDQFPQKTFEKLGYKHFALNGIKGYHGVAIVSRWPFADSLMLDLMKQQDGRHIAVALTHGKHRIWLHNFYVPAGGDIPDAKANSKFAYKLDYLDAMAKYFRSKAGQAPQQILVGDLNTAPLEHDVWSHKQLLDVVCHTPIEIKAHNRIQASRDWQDIGRHFVPPDKKLYSWWSYRARDWAASDRGRRLDHIWSTPNLLKSCINFKILRTARDWSQPSDHVPVFAQFKF